MVAGLPVSESSAGRGPGEGGGEERASSSTGRRSAPWSCCLFEELLESVREGGEILRGEREASRRVQVEEPDVAGVRERYSLSQEPFAALLGIRVRTLQSWEQGHPEAVLDTVRTVG